MAETRPLAPPARDPVPAGLVPAVRGERVILRLHDDFQYGFRGWTDIHTVTWGDLAMTDDSRHRLNLDQPVDVIGVVQELVWWRHRLLDAAPAYVHLWPADQAWIE